MASNGSSSPKNKEFWNYLEENYKEVVAWPTWMRGESASCAPEATANFVQEPETQHDSDDEG